MASNCDSHWYIKGLWEFWINIHDDSIIKVRVVFPHKSDNHDMVRVILLMKMTTNAVVTWSAFSITDENSGNKTLKNPAAEAKVFCWQNVWINNGRSSSCWCVNKTVLIFCLSFVGQKWFIKVKFQCTIRILVGPKHLSHYTNVH